MAFISGAPSYYTTEEWGPRDNAYIFVEGSNVERYCCASEGQVCGWCPEEKIAGQLTNGFQPDFIASDVQFFAKVETPYKGSENFSEWTLPIYVPNTHAVADITGGYGFPMPMPPYSAYGSVSSGEMDLQMRPEVGNMDYEHLPIGNSSYPVQFYALDKGQSSSLYDPWQVGPPMEISTGGGGSEQGSASQPPDNTLKPHNLEAMWDSTGATSDSEDVALGELGGDPPGSQIESAMGVAPNVSTPITNNSSEPDEDMFEEEFPQILRAMRKEALKATEGDLSESEARYLTSPMKIQLAMDLIFRCPMCGQYYCRKDAVKRHLMIDGYSGHWMNKDAATIIINHVWGDDARVNRTLMSQDDFLRMKVLEILNAP